MLNQLEGRKCKPGHLILRFKVKTVSRHCWYLRNQWFQKLQEVTSNKLWLEVFRRMCLVNKSKQLVLGLNSIKLKCREKLVKGFLNLAQIVNTIKLWLVHPPRVFHNHKMAQERNSIKRELVILHNWFPKSAQAVTTIKHRLEHQFAASTNPKVLLQEPNSTKPK